MIVIEIDNLQVNQRSGEKDGKPWVMTTQQITIHGHLKDGFPSKYPYESSITLDKDKPAPFAIGKYVIGAESFYFDKYGHLTFGRMSLQPLAQFLAEIKKQFEVKAAA